MLTQDGYGCAVDLWSAGVVLYILLCGEPPFSAETDVELFDLIKNASYSLNTPEWDMVSYSAKQLVKGLLDKNAKTRLDASSALKHPWIVSCGIKDDVAVLIDVPSVLSAAEEKELLEFMAQLDCTPRSTPTSTPVPSVSHDGGNDDEWARERERKARLRRQRWSQQIEMEYRWNEFDERMTEISKSMPTIPRHHADHNVARLPPVDAPRPIVSAIPEESNSLEQPRVLTVKPKSEDDFDIQIRSASDAPKPRTRRASVADPGTPSPTPKPKLAPIPDTNRPSPLAMSRPRPCVISTQKSLDSGKISPRQITRTNSNTSMDSTGSRSGHVTSPAPAPVHVPRQKPGLSDATLSRLTMSTVSSSAKAKAHTTVAGHIANVDALMADKDQARLKLSEEHRQKRMNTWKKYMVKNNQDENNQTAIAARVAQYKSQDKESTVRFQQAKEMFKSREKKASDDMVVSFQKTVPEQSEEEIEKAKRAANTRRRKSVAAELYVASR